MADSPPAAGGLNVRFGWNPAYPRDQRDEKGQRLGGKNDWMTCRPVRADNVTFQGSSCPDEAAEKSGLRPRTLNGTANHFSLEGVAISRHADYGDVRGSGKFDRSDHLRRGASRQNE